jgi:hypothetical protein
MIGKCITQLVRIVERTAKSLLNQQAINQFIAVIVSKEIVIPEAEIEEEIEEGIEEVEETNKCIEQLVMIVEKVVKFLLDQAEINRFIVVNVLVKEKVRVRADLINPVKNMLKWVQNWIKS